MSHLVKSKVSSAPNSASPELSSPVALRTRKRRSTRPNATAADTAFSEDRNMVLKCDETKYEEKVGSERSSKIPRGSFNASIADPVKTSLSEKPSGVRELSSLSSSLDGGRRNNRSQNTGPTKKTEAEMGRKCMKVNKKKHEESVQSGSNSSHDQAETIPCNLSLVASSSQRPVVKLVQTSPNSKVSSDSRVILNSISTRSSNITTTRNKHLEDVNSAVVNSEDNEVKHIVCIDDIAREVPKKEFERFNPIRSNDNFVQNWENPRDENCSDFASETLQNYAELSESLVKKVKTCVEKRSQSSQGTASEIREKYKKFDQNRAIIQKTSGPNISMNMNTKQK